MHAVKTAQKTLTLRLPEPLHREARVLSVERGESLNAILTDLLSKWVAHYSKEAK